MADETDFNTQVERTLTLITRTIVLAMKTPLLVVDLFRSSTLTSMISEGGAERRYLGPQSLLVLAFLLKVCLDYMPHRIAITEPKVLMPRVIEQEKFHYLLEFFLWFAIFSLVRAVTVHLFRLTGREKRFFEHILGYATAVPLILLVSEQIVETLLIYIGWEKVSRGYPSYPDLFQFAIFALAALGITLVYPFALLYRATRTVSALNPQRLGRKPRFRGVFLWAGAGTLAVVASQLLFAECPHIIDAILPQPLSVQILDMYLTAKATAPTALPVAISLKVTNRSDEDVFADVSGISLFAEKYGEIPIVASDRHKEFIKIGKDSSEVILVKRMVQAPREANMWTVNIPVRPALRDLSISTPEPFLFWPPADECFGEYVTNPCAAKVDNR